MNILGKYKKTSSLQSVFGESWKQMIKDHLQFMKRGDDFVCDMPINERGVIREIALSVGIKVAFQIIDSKYFYVIKE